MFLRILEFVLTAIVLTLAAKEILIPLIVNKPLFPLVRRTMAGNPVTPDSPAAKKKRGF